MTIRQYKGYAFESDCVRTPEYAEFEKQCKKELKAQCKKVGFKVHSFHPNHFEWSAVLEKDGKLAYFLMTDAERSSQGGFPIDGFWYLSNYSQDHPHPAYAANDETFAELWPGYYEMLDLDEKTLTYSVEGDNGEWSTKTFSDKGY